MSANNYLKNYTLNNSIESIKKPRLGVVFFQHLQHHMHALFKKIYPEDDDNLSYVLFSIAFVGCQPDTAPKISAEVKQQLSDFHYFEDLSRFSNSTQSDAICPQHSTDCYDYAEARVLHEYAPILQRSDSQTLTLQQYNGKNKIYRSNLTDSDLYAHYQVIQVYPTLNCVLLYVQLYEGNTYILFNLATAQETQLSSPPIWSPDFKTMVSIGSDVFAGYNLNALDIYQVDAQHQLNLQLQGIERIETLMSAQNIGVSALKWLSNDVFIVQTDHEDMDQHDGLAHRYFKFKRNDAEATTNWQINELDDSAYQALYEQ